jgi:hypothetical protein
MEPMQRAVGSPRAGAQLCTTQAYLVDLYGRHRYWLDCFMKAFASVIRSTGSAMSRAQKGRLAAEEAQFEELGTLHQG